MRHTGDVAVTIPTTLRQAIAANEGGPEWLQSIPARAARAAERWELVLGEPFDTGMAGWTAPATTQTGIDVVVKLSFPHAEARNEGAALAAWRGAGAVEVLDTDAGDWALLLRRLRPGSTLRDAGLPVAEHLTVGAGLCRQAVDLLSTLAGEADLCGLAHGDLNPGNILRDDLDIDSELASSNWRAIDPKPVHGDLAFDPWPLLTQVGEWTAVVASAAELANRAKLVADSTGLDAARVTAWCVARGVESALWAADRGWWTGHRGADRDLARSAAWAEAAARFP